MFSWLVRWMKNEHITLGTILSPIYKLKNDLIDHTDRLDDRIYNKKSKITDIRVEAANKTQALQTEVEQHTVEKENTLKVLALINTSLNQD